MQQKKTLKDIPIRFHESFKFIRHHCSVYSFIPLYDTMDDGMKYSHNKYFEEDQEDFPNGIATKRFHQIIQFIQSNFPVREEQHYLLKLFEFELCNFADGRDQELNESIQRTQSFGKDSSVEERQLDIILKIRQTYQKLYKEFVYEISGEKEKDEAEHQYILNWLYRNVTLKEWIKNRNIDHWFFLNQIISQSDFSDEEIQEIEHHQESLFFQHVKNIVDSIIQRYANRDIEKRKEIVNRHLRAIEVFFDDGNNSETALQNLRNIYGDIRVSPTELLQAYNAVINQNYDYKTNLLLGDGETFRSHPFLCAHVLYNYKQRVLNLFNQPKRQKTRLQNNSFGIKQPNKTIWLEDLLIQLQFKIEFLREPSTPEKLYDLLTFKNYNDIKEPIQLNCETKQFVYIINKLKPKFSKLTYANIERSAKFISSDGNLIKADNMSNSKTDYPKEKEEIDAVFNAFI